MGGLHTCVRACVRACAQRCCCCSSISCCPPRASFSPPRHHTTPHHPAQRSPAGGGCAASHVEGVGKEGEGEEDAPQACPLVHLREDGLHGGVPALVVLNVAVLQARQGRAGRHTEGGTHRSAGWQVAGWLAVWHGCKGLAFPAQHWAALPWLSASPPPSPATCMPAQLGPPQASSAPAPGPLAGWLADRLAGSRLRGGCGGRCASRGRAP